METKIEANDVDEQVTSSHREQRLVVPLPCPFCGKTPKMDWHESYGGYKIRVIYCHAKKCHIKPSVRVAKLVGMKDADARAQALSRWNYRHKGTPGNSKSSD